MKKILKLSKRLISLILIVFMTLVCLSGEVFAAPLTQGDGNAYFYFAASGLDVDKFRNGISVNGNAAIQYITSDIIARTERIDKSLLIPHAENYITIYTGTDTAVVDESKSRSEAGTGCDEFGVTQANLSLILPNGLIVTPSKKMAYYPKDTTTPLEDSHITSVVESGGQIALGDANLTDYAYKLEIYFDLTNVDWDSQNDITPNTPSIKNVSLQIGAQPSERNIVWYSTSQSDSVVQLALKSDMTGADFPQTFTSFAATANVTGLTGYTSYKATMTGLAEKTEYVYRVGNDTDGWSETYDFRTQGFDGDFQFLVVTDPQLGQGNRFNNIADELAGWTNTLDISKQNFTSAAFLACLGDQIANAQIDGQYDVFFAPNALKSFALAPVPGNHDIGANWTPHYNVPNLSTLGVHNTMGAGSGDYWFTYGDVLFMSLNVMNSGSVKQHIQFMEETIEANPTAKWRIAMMHYGMFGGTAQFDGNATIENLRSTLAPALSRLGIDVVLNGHEHRYTRSYLMNAFTPNTNTGGASVTDPNPNEVLYMTFNSASGTDYVNTVISNTAHIAISDQQLTPNVSTVDVTDNSFKFTTYESTSEMEVVDTFTINRTAGSSAVKSVHISPKTATVKSGSTQGFTAEALGYGTPSQDVVWSVKGNESAGTKISEDGILTVADDELAENLVITVASAKDSSKYASAEVMVDNNITDINVGQGITYALPTSIGDVSVTKWTDYDGDTVEKVTTAHVGYRYYTAVLEDGTTAIYRVNVGEYEVLMSDDLNSYTKDQYQAKVTRTLTGGEFYKSAYAEADNSYQSFNADGSNVFAVFGKGTSANTNFYWMPTDTAKGEAFKISYKLRVASLDLNDLKSTSDVYYFTNNLDNTSGIQLRSKIKQSGGVYSLGETQLRCQGGENTSLSVIANINDYVSWTEPDANNIVSMTDYITIDIEGNDVQYSARVNGVEVANSVPYVQENLSNNGVTKINWAKRNSGDVGTITYADDLVYSKAVYVTDSLTKVNVSANVEQGSSAAQTAAVTLNMSDGSTKNFTINYIADTSSAGVKTTTGTIVGFDGEVKVTYTVAVPTSINKIENNKDGKTQVIISNNTALAEGTKLLVAVYDSEPSTMKKVCSVELNEEHRAAGEQTVILSEDILSSMAGSLIKVFIWNGECAPLAQELENP